MPIQKLSLAQVTPMLQNVAYAMPGVKSAIYTDAATPTIQASNTSDFTLNTTVTLTNGQADVHGGFIRCTSGNINVRVIN